MATEYVTNAKPKTFISRSDSLLGIVQASSDYRPTPADIEYEEKKKDKIDSINQEIERRKTAFKDI